MNRSKLAILSLIFGFISAQSFATEGSLESSSMVSQQQIRLGGSAALFDGSQGMDVSASYAQKGVFEEFLAPFSREWRGVGVSAQQTSSSEETSAKTLSVFVEQTFDETLPDFLKDLPVYAVVRLGLTDYSIEGDNVDTGLGAYVSPEVHVQIPQFSKDWDLDVTGGYSFVLGSESLSYLSVGLSLAYKNW